MCFTVNRAFLKKKSIALSQTSLDKQRLKEAVKLWMNSENFVLMVVLEEGSINNLWGGHEYPDMCCCGLEDCHH